MRVSCVILAACFACSSFAQVKTWTSTADFNEGLYFNTNGTAQPGEVRMNRSGTAPVPFLNVPVGGREVANRGWIYTPGRIVRVDTNTGVVVGEYRATPNTLESAPSRAVVDSQGNVWVTNSYESSGTPGFTKIGVLIGGTRYYKPAEGLYIPHPLGEYVKDPVYTTGVDRDGDGYIRTSTGLGSLLAWNATAGQDLDSSNPAGAPGTVTQADDELILVYKRLPTGGGKVRGIAVDENDDIWVAHQVGAGGVHKMDNATGAFITTYTQQWVGYGMLYSNGFIYGSAGDQGSQHPWKINVLDGTFTPVTGARRTYVGVYAPLPNGDIVASTMSGHGPTELVVIDGVTADIKAYIPVPGSADMRGVAVDQDGFIWVCSRGLWAGGPQLVYKIAQDGTVVSSFQTGARPCGIGLDANGFVWVTHIGEPGNQENGKWTTVIDPRANSGLGAIIGQVSLGTGSYNYSDGTGATTSVIARSGEWRGTYDSFRPNVKWGRVNWTANVPQDTSLRVYVRSANTRLGLNGADFVEMTSGGNLGGSISGRYLEARAVLARAEGTDPSLTPSLRDLTVRFADGTVSGTVGLANWEPVSSPNARFTLRNTGGDTVINDIEVGPFGAFAFTTALRGEFNLLAKTTHWLQDIFPTTINITDSGVTGVVYALVNGDCDGNNIIDIADYTMLAAGFSAVVGDSRYSLNIDLNGDGIVDVSDYGILSQSFSRVGVD